MTKQEKAMYMVSTGSYSDYQIEAVFSTRELAENYVASQAPEGAFPGWAVEEIELDPPTDRHQKHLYTSWSISFPADVNQDIPQVSSATEQPAVAKIGARSLPAKVGFCNIETISLVSAEHAHKLAVEYRQGQLRLTCGD